MRRTRDADPSKKRSLTLSLLQEEAATFSEAESVHREPTLYGVTDGKAVGTYFEHKFQDYLAGKYAYESGSSAAGMDFPGLSVDMKVTSIKQPQSSSPFKSARQKIFGLGYSLLVFVYEKTDNRRSRTSTLKVLHTVFVDACRTGDYQTTTGLRRILENNGNQDDLVAFMYERNLPLDETETLAIAQELLRSPPEIGYLAISNALQWRLQYTRVIEKAGAVSGVIRLRKQP
jgi:hypothetical protein